MKARKVCGAAGRLAAAAWLLGLLFGFVPAPAAAQRQLRWDALEVEARLDGEGLLQVRERHTMVFTGDWNGGERVFRLASGQPFEFLGMARVDPASGAALPLAEGSLARVDEFDWIDRRTLRWRSRLPSDPVFEETRITYLLDYRIGGVLRPLGERYRLDHDFAFPDRAWPIARFVLDLELDPSWEPAAPLGRHYESGGLAPGESFVVTADLRYAAAGHPAAVRRLPPIAARAAAFALAAAAMLWLLLDLHRHERRLGRFDPPAPPPRADPGWLEENLFDLPPEEAGALWDRAVGPPEVAAILARWELEGRVRSKVVPGRGIFGRDLLTLELVADRGSFAGYERKLMEKLFFDGRTETDTDAIREHYKSRGFDPASTIRSGLESARDGQLRLRPGLQGKGVWRTRLLWLTALALMIVEALGRPLPTLQLALLTLVPLVVLYLLFGLVFAFVWRRNLGHLHLLSLGFLLPGLMFYAGCAAAVFFDRWLPGTDFAPQPGLAGSLALAALAVGVWSSLLNHARSRERPEGLRKRQLLAAARRLLAWELRRPSPGLRDEWMPYLLALGLGPRVDRWWRRYGQAAEAATVAASAGDGRFGAAGSGRSSWTGGGGTFGGAGASASWVAAATGVAAGVARPGSGGSSGGGGGGGSSGGGGGGGW